MQEALVTMKEAIAAVRGTSWSGTSPVSMSHPEVTNRRGWILTKDFGSRRLHPRLGHHVSIVIFNQRYSKSQYLIYKISKYFLHWLICNYLIELIQAKHHFTVVKGFS